MQTLHTEIIASRAFVASDPLCLDFLSSSSPLSALHHEWQSSKHTQMVFEDQKIQR